MPQKAGLLTGHCAVRQEALELTTEQRARMVTLRRDFLRDIQAVVAERRRLNDVVRGAVPGCVEHTMLATEYDKVGATKPCAPSYSAAPPKRESFTTVTRS